MNLSIITKNENETRQIAKAIASIFDCGDLILLEGDLGTGKTYFVKGFAEGISSVNIVTSPTFSIANFYRGPSQGLLHIDLYRIETIKEFTDLGLSDYFSQNIVLIEWGTKFADEFDEFLLISLEYVDDHKDTRKITFSHKGERFSSILNEINQKLSSFSQC